MSLCCVICSVYQTTTDNTADVYQSLYNLATAREELFMFPWCLFSLLKTPVQLSRSCNKRWNLIQTEKNVMSFVKKEEEAYGVCSHRPGAAHSSEKPQLSCFVLLLLGWGGLMVFICLLRRLHRQWEYNHNRAAMMGSMWEAPVSHCEGPPRHESAT